MKFLRNTALWFTATASVTVLVVATPVEIRVRCNGIDFSSLTLQDAAVSGQVLASSYASVHEIDATSLYNVSYHGAIVSSLEALDEDVPATRDNTDSSSSSLDGMFGKHKYTGQFAATWDCADEACPDEDDVAETVAWENEFVAGLIMSSVASFGKVKTCAIDLEPASTDVTNEPNVDVGVKCNKKGVLDHLSVAEGTFLGKVLQESYAKVHDSDDFVLDKVFFHKKTKKGLSNVKSSSPDSSSSSSSDTGSSSNLRVTCDPLRRASFCWYRYEYRNYYWSGATRCTRCAANMMQQQLISLTDSIAAAWEAELVAKLNQGPFIKFHGVTECEIGMEPHNLQESLTVEESADEGLTTDTDEKHFHEQSVQLAAVDQE